MATQTTLMKVDLRVEKMIQKLEADKRIQLWLLVSLAISFMLCIFAPIDAYYANKDEFWFSLGQMLTVSIVAFLQVFAYLCAIGIAGSKSMLSDFLYLVAIGLFLYLYVQGNYIPRNYSVLNGTEIDWTSYTGYAVASIILGVAVIGLCALMLI